MYEVGKTEENPNAKGLALRKTRKTSTQITQLSAPTSDHDDETMEKFYDAKLLTRTPVDVKLSWVTSVPKLSKKYR